MQEMQEMREELANMKTMLKGEMDRIEVKFDKIVDMVSRQCEFVVFFFFCHLLIHKQQHFLIVS
jgi:hypothetical protein